MSRRLTGRRRQLSNAGRPGEVVAIKIISGQTDQAGGTAWVRGHDLRVLVEHPGFEGTMAVLRDGFGGMGLTPAPARCLGRARLAAYAPRNAFALVFAVGHSAD